MQQFKPIFSPWLKSEVLLCSAHEFLSPEQIFWEKTDSLNCQPLSEAEGEVPDAAGFVIQVARISNPGKHLSLSAWEGWAASQHQNCSFCLDLAFPCGLLLGRMGLSFSKLFEAPQLLKSWEAAAGVEVGGSAPVLSFAVFHGDSWLHGFHTHTRGERRICITGGRSCT